MALSNLDDIEAEVMRLAAVVGARDWELPTYGYSYDDGRPHIELAGSNYHYVVMERGQERQRRSTHELDELFYWIFESITFSLASQYEVAHRVPGRDFRRLLFERQLDLLASLSLEWSKRQATEQAEILRLHPFDDLSKS